MFMKKLRIQRARMYTGSNCLRASRPGRILRRSSSLRGGELLPFAARDVMAENNAETLEFWLAEI